MGNPISDQIKTGTIGELLVQLRLLQFGVQAAPPLKDSGNDLIAVRGEEFKGVQVKTRTGNRVQFGALPDHYHVLAYVELRGEENLLYLDETTIYLLSRDDIEKGIDPKNMGEFQITQDRVDELFPLERN